MVYLLFLSCWCKYTDTSAFYTRWDYNAGGTQTQNFTYDSLDRLRAASASGGTGGAYSESTPTMTPPATWRARAGWGRIASTPTTSMPSIDRGESYQYDANGNQTRRVTASGTYTLTYDAESRMVGVSGAVTASFVYDGDGQRVKGTVSGTVVYYLGSHYEYQPSGGGSIQRKYYGSGGVRVAMRTVTKASNGSELTNVVNWLFGDHLGSTGRSANEMAPHTSEQRYRAWGEKRYPDGDSTLPTTYSLHRPT